MSAFFWSIRTMSLQFFRLPIVQVDNECSSGITAQGGQPRIALDVGVDAVFFNNPDLPETRSEAALPMKVRGETIGVLDVQSTDAGAFSTEDLQVLTAL